MDDTLPQIAKGVVDGLREGLPTCKTVVMIEAPDGRLYYASNCDTALEVTNIVCSTGWQMASRILPPVTPTHDRPEMMQ